MSWRNTNSVYLAEYQFMLNSNGMFEYHNWNWRSVTNILYEG